MKRKLKAVTIFAALAMVIMFTLSSCGGVTEDDIKGYWATYDNDIYYFDGNGNIINYNGDNGNIFSEDFYKIKGKKIEMIDAEDGDIIKTFTYKSKDVLYDNGRNTEFIRTDNPFGGGGSAAGAEAEVAGYWSLPGYVYYFDGEGNVTVHFEDGEVYYVDKYQITSDEYRDYVELIDADDGEVYRTLNVEGEGIMFAPDYNEEYTKLAGSPF
jgi:hypothetical protein